MLFFGAIFLMCYFLTSLLYFCCTMFVHFQISLHQFDNMFAQLFEVVYLAKLFPHNEP
jgi:hypothetical protein